MKQYTNLKFLNQRIILLFRQIKQLTLNSLIFAAKVDPCVMAALLGVFKTRFL